MDNIEELKLNIRDKKGTEFLFFDFFIYDPELNFGAIKIQQSKEVEEFKKFIDSETKEYKLESVVDEENFGRGADWVMASVKFFTSEGATALANIGGVIGLAIIFRELFKKVRNKFNRELRIGIQSACLLAIDKILELNNSNITGINIIFQKEIVKNYLGFDEKFFIFLIMNKNNGEGDYVFLVLDWRGNTHTFVKL